VVLPPWLVDCELGATATVKPGCAAAVRTRLAEAVWLSVPLVAVIVSGYVPVAVVLVVVTVKVDEPEPATDVGAKEPLAPVGNPLTLNDTFPVKPLLGVIEAV
jgi:hypothetical protein